MVAGGSSPELTSVEVISSELTNKELTQLPKEISRSPSLFLDGDNLLLCGGLGNKNKCLKYDNDSWKEHSTLIYDRMWASAVTTVDGTFIFGGFDSRGTFEFLPKNSKVWEEGRTKIPDGFTIGCAVKVANKQEILLIGGSGTYTRILKFDIETQTFEVAGVSLIKERQYHTCARLPDTNLIVITGGWDSDFNAQDTSEILNLEDNTITLGNPMNTKRYLHGMAVITIDNEDRLAVLGGKDENVDFLYGVETLNPRTRKWELSDLKLKEAKMSFGYTSLPNDFISKL